MFILRANCIIEDRLLAVVVIAGVSGLSDLLKNRGKAQKHRWKTSKSHSQPLHLKLKSEIEHAQYQS